MPKRAKNIYQQLLSFEVMHEAWFKARKGKRFKHAVLSFERDLEPNLYKLIGDLKSESYVTGGYRSFYVHEPKLREVCCLTEFRDRVLQHAVVSIIEPIFESVFIKDSFACRKGKGTHAGVDRAQQMIRAVKREYGVVYALKCDIAKYFQNIDHNTLIRLLKNKIADERMMRLLTQIIISFGNNGKGLPLGNLTSQLFANIYLNHLDQLIKRVHREVNYMRYMDDFIIVHYDKNHLHKLRRETTIFLRANLGLELNRKTAVFPVANKRGRPVDFLGYRITANKKLLRKSAIKALRRKLRLMHKRYSSGEIGFSEIKIGLASHIGHANHADSSALLHNIFNKPFKREINSEQDLYCI